jgi:hypothetical protein
MLQNGTFHTFLSQNGTLHSGTSQNVTFRYKTVERYKTVQLINTT